MPEKEIADSEWDLAIAAVAVAANVFACPELLAILWDKGIDDEDIYRFCVEAAMPLNEASQGVRDQDWMEVAQRYVEAITERIQKEASTPLGDAGLLEIDTKSALLEALNPGELTN